MKKAKLVIAVIFLAVLCASAAWAEYKLVMRFGIVFSVFASVSGLFVVLGALLRAPEGYEGENGFHIRARRKRAVLDMSSPCPPLAADPRSASLRAGLTASAVGLTSRRLRSDMGIVGSRRAIETAAF